jgi:hypothetical protein
VNLQNVQQCERRHNGSETDPRKAKTLLTLLLTSVDCFIVCGLVHTFVPFLTMLCFLFYPEDGGSGLH